MTSYRIAQVAELVGVAPSALRYYENIGLVAKPSRGSNGYRTYDDADVARLAFVTNAKNLGIPLDDVRDLVIAYDVEDCANVAHHIVELVSARLADTRTRIADLAVLADQLHGVSERLASSPAAGACGAGCPCATVTVDAPLTDNRVLVPLTHKQPRGIDAGQAGGAVASGDLVLACTLDGVGVTERVQQWREVVAAATARTEVPGGADLTFIPDPSIAGRLAALAADEQACCPFLTFTLHFAPDKLRLEIRAPADAASLVTALLSPT